METSFKRSNDSNNAFLYSHFSVAVLSRKLLQIYGENFIWSLFIILLINQHIILIIPSS